VGAKRIIWHVGLERILRRRGPRSFEIRAEVPLSDEPARMDYLLLRRSMPADPGADAAETLRGLWPMLPRVSVVEYKSPGHPYRPGHLDRLWSYTHAYFASQRALPRRRATSGSLSRADGTPLEPGADGGPEVLVREDLCAVLIVPARTPSLDDDVTSMGLSWKSEGPGYWRAVGGLFALFVVEIDVVGPAEGDDLLYSLGHGDPRVAAARWFWLEFVGQKEAGMSMQDMEGYDELLERVLQDLPPEQRMVGLAPEQRMVGLAPEQRVAGVPPEQRLAGLDRDHQALALPLELLRLLPEEYLRSLSPEVQAELRRRLKTNGH
jgi:hypothetical protein